MTSRTGNFNDRRRWRGGGVRNQYGQVVKVNGTLKTDKQQNRHGQGRVAEVEENIIFKDFIEYKKLKDEKFEVEAFYTKEVFTEFVNFHARLKGMLGGPQ